MRRINRFSRSRYRQRYGRYRRFFFISMALFFLFSLLEIIYYGAGGRICSPAPVNWKTLFPVHFTSEVSFYLIAFLLGITVYAPAFQFVSISLRGVFSAYLLSCIAAVLDQKGNVFLFVLVLFYVLASTCMFCAYSSFCSMVSLRLFSDGTLKNYRAEEKRIFGGTLFNSSLFCNTVNLRFLSVYVLFFFCALVLEALMALVYSFLCGAIL